MYIRFLQFRSSLLPESFLLSFPHPTKIFQFGWFRLPFGIHALLACGFAHSDSSGSLLTYSSPKRFAVRRVLLRLLVPRHPLCALISLTFFHSNSTNFIQFSKISSSWETTFKSLKTIYDFTKLFFPWEFFIPSFLLRKEVIHPHVLVGIPCYDLTPIICPTLDGSFLAVQPPASGITNSHGLTGGVYKARERIHRDILIRDY